MILTLVCGIVKVVDSWVVVVERGSVVAKPPIDLCIMFRGISNIAVDAKGRVAIPKSHREPLIEVANSQLMLTVGPDNCLLVYPLHEWWPTEEKIMALPNTNPVHRRMQLMYVGHATKTDIDKSGRIMLPVKLREYARIENKAVMVGQGRRLEIWSEDRWLDESENWPEQLASVDVDDLSAEAQALSL